MFKLNFTTSIQNTYINLSIDDVACWNKNEWQLKPSKEIAEKVKKGIKWLEIKKQQENIMENLIKKLCKIISSDLSHINGKIPSSEEILAIVTKKEKVDQIK
jgi:hypothetical protein